MIYAPVVIPTLNRYEHLRQCLESLSRCTWAEQTEVYVALDYPPIDKWDKYAPGWEKNRDWLRSIGDFGFKKLHLIERTENYGTWLPGQKGNGRYLIQDEILPRYDRYIFTEDDNVFAPCFLEYVNKGLEKYKDDKTVYCLTGFKFPLPFRYKENTFFRQGTDCCPWGVARWTNKFVKPELDYRWFRKHLTLRNLLRVNKMCGPYFTASFFDSAVNDWKYTSPIDTHWTIYMAIMGLQQICPTVALSKNIGLDGSGEMGANDTERGKRFREISISSNLHFDFVGTGYEYFDENTKIYRLGKLEHSALTDWKRVIKKVVKYMLSFIK